MSRIAEVPLGPYAKWVEDYFAVSRAAYDLLSDLEKIEIEDLNHTDRSMIVGISLQAEATSLAARSALTHGLAVSALALLRVRLEQCVVSSFLTHVPACDGWDKYVQDVRASGFEVTAKSQDMARPSRRTRPSLEAEVVEIGEGAYIDNSGKFKRRWTDLSLEGMAKRRDHEAATVSPLPWKLAEEYWRVYPIGSLAVHGACEATLWNTHLHEPALGSGQRYPYIIPLRARHWAAALARYDVVQAWETLAALTTPPIQQATTLVALYDSGSSGDA